MGYREGWTGYMAPAVLACIGLSMMRAALGATYSQEGVPVPTEYAAPDPEATAQGRNRYLGREIARFMSWRGANWLKRDTRQNEEDVASLHAWLNVREGDSLADFGCGNGYHALLLAEAVGPKGRVFGVDLQPEMLEFLTERAAAAGVENVIPIESALDDPKLPENSCDVILLVDVYHELSHPVRVLRGLGKALTEDGVIVLVEYRAEDRSVPIKPRHKMTKAQVIAEMATNGWVLTRETDELPWQHAMAFAVAPTVDSAAPGTRKPPLEVRAMARGFVQAMGQGDPRVVYPFLGKTVDLGDPSLEEGKAVSIRIGEAMKASDQPLIPGGTGLTWKELPAETFQATLIPPGGTPVHEGRLSLTLGRDGYGVFRVTGWRRPASPPR